jgi:hypothetical protein
MRRVVLGELRCEVSGKGGSLWSSGIGDLFCGTDTVIGDWQPRKKDKVANKCGDDTLS